MDPQMDIYIPIDPKTLPTAQQKGERVVYGRNGKAFVHHYEKAKVAKGRRRVEQWLSITTPSDFIKIEKGSPVFVKVEFVYSLGSKPKRMQGTFKASRPDTDNLLKGLFDACTNAGLWEDDSQVQISGAFRRYQKADEEPHILLSVSTSPDVF